MCFRAQRAAAAPRLARAWRPWLSGGGHGNTAAAPPRAHGLELPCTQGLSRVPRLQMLMYTVNNRMLIVDPFCFRPTEIWPSTPPSEIGAVATVTTSGIQAWFARWEPELSHLWRLYMHLYRPVDSHLPGDAVNNAPLTSYERVAGERHRTPAHP